MSFPFEETILKWDPEIEVTNDFKMKDYPDWSNPLARKKNPLPALEKLPPLDDILNSVFPVRKFEINGKKYVQFVSAEEPERKVVKYELTAELQKKLKERQAR